jgi:hypothetical protein
MGEQSFPSIPKANIAVDNQIISFQISNLYLVSPSLAVAHHVDAPNIGEQLIKNQCFVRVRKPPSSRTSAIWESFLI